MRISDGRLTLDASGVSSGGIKGRIQNSWATEEAGLFRTADMLYERLLEKERK